MEPSSQSPNSDNGLFVLETEIFNLGLSSLPNIFTGLISVGIRVGRLLSASSGTKSVLPDKGSRQG